MQTVDDIEQQPPKTFEEAVAYVTEYLLQHPRTYELEFQNPTRPNHLIEAVGLLIRWLEESGVKVRNLAVRPRGLLGQPHGVRPQRRTKSTRRSPEREALQRVLDYLGDDEHADYESRDAAEKSNHLFRDLRLLADWLLSANDLEDQGVQILFVRGEGTQP